jgi:hypothetical protein
MPLWLAIVFAVCSIVVGPWAAHTAAKRGAQRGLDIALAVHDTLIKEMQREIVMLRQAKHEHAGFLTRHEAEIEVLQRRMDKK